MHVSTHRSAPPLQVVTGAQHTSCLSPKRIQTDFVSLIRMFRKYSSSSQADSNFYKLLTEAANSRILSAYEKILVHTCMGHIATSIGRMDFFTASSTKMETELNLGNASS